MRRKKLTIIIATIVCVLLCMLTVDCNASSKSNVNIDNDVKALAENDSDFIGTIILQSLGFGAIASTIICVIIGVKHKPVKVSKNANQYLDTNSVNITNKYDHFKNYTVSKVSINNK